MSPAPPAGQHRQKDPKTLPEETEVSHHAHAAAGEEAAGGAARRRRPAHPGRSGPPVLSAVLPRQRAAPSAPPCSAQPELWFSEWPRDLAEAKARCEYCPLRRECLAGALERREPWGVWGGQIVLDGVVVAHKRGRGRPRKDERAA